MGFASCILYCATASWVVRDIKKHGYLEKAPKLIQQLTEASDLLSQNLLKGTETSVEEALKNMHTCQDIFQEMSAGEIMTKNLLEQYYLNAIASFQGYNERIIFISAKHTEELCATKDRDEKKKI